MIKIKINKLLSIIIITGIFAIFIPSNLGYGQTQQEEKETKFPLIAKLPPQRQVPLSKQFDVKPYVSTLFGYDNNVNLNSARKGDLLAEELFGLDMIFKLAKDLKVRFNYIFTNIGYFEIKDSDLQDHFIELSVEKNIGSKWTLKPHIGFDGVMFFHDTISSYLENNVGLKIKYKITDKLYNSLDYSYVYRNYYKRNIGDYYNVRQNKNRDDDRNVLEYEIGSFHLKNTLLKFKYRYYFNHSNYNYLSYYDYNDRQIYVSAVHLFTDKLTGFASFAYEMRDYRTRTVPDINVAQEDNIYKTTAAFFYDMTKNISLNLTYSWRENDSNDPAEKYAGFIITSGLTYTF